MFVPNSIWSIEMCTPNPQLMTNPLARKRMLEMQAKKPETLGQAKPKCQTTILTAHPETAQRKTLLGV